MKTVASGAAVAAVLLLCTVDAGADVGAEAAVLHAEALVSEMDADPGGSLVLLREAIALVPGDIAVAFDLARVAMDGGETPESGDLEPFLKLTAETSEEHKLRAYILAEREDLAGAAAAIEAEDRGGGESGDIELAELRTQLGAYLDALADSEPEKLLLHLFMGGEGDSNITLEPGARPSRKLGVRLVVDGGVTLALFDSLPQLQGAFDFQIGTHVNGRNAIANLGAYDSATARLRFSFGTELGPVETYFEAFGAFVATETFSAHFMHEIGGFVEARLPLAITPGVYFEAAWQDFVTGNGEYKPGAIEPAPVPRPTRAILVDQVARDAFKALVADNIDYAEPQNDRDGVHIGVGASAEWLHDTWGIILRAGFAGEFTQGPQQQQRGFDVAAFVPIQIGDLEATASLSLDWRVYPNWLGRRTDVRLTPRVDLKYVVADWFAVRAAYTFVLNASSGARRFLEDYYRVMDQVDIDWTRLLDSAWWDEPDTRSTFDYTRHIVSLGVEGNF